MSRLVYIFVLLLALLPTGSSAGPIYVFKESDGTIRFTDRKPAEHIDAKIYTSKSPKFTYHKGNAGYSVSAKRYSYNYRFNPKHVKKYESVISGAAREYSIEPALIKAVIHAESAFNPHARSPKGAIGLMQLMPGTARDLGVRAHIAEENIDGGVRYLSQLLKEFSGNLVYALAAYNAGQENVRKYKGVPPFDETRTYVRRVLALRKSYITHG